MILPSRKKTWASRKRRPMSRQLRKMARTSPGWASVARSKSLGVRAEQERRGRSRPRSRPCAPRARSRAMTCTASRSSRSSGISGSRSGCGISGSRARPAGRSGGAARRRAGRGAASSPVPAPRGAGRRLRLAGGAGLPRGAARGSRAWAGISRRGGDLADDAEARADVPAVLAGLPRPRRRSACARARAGTGAALPGRTIAARAARRLRVAVALVVVGVLRLLRLGVSVLVFFHLFAGVGGRLARGSSTGPARRTFAVGHFLCSQYLCRDTRRVNVPGTSPPARPRARAPPGRARRSAGGWRRRPRSRSAATWSGVGYPLCRAKP